MGRVAGGEMASVTTSSPAGQINVHGIQTAARQAIGAADNEHHRKSTDHYKFIHELPLLVVESPYSW